MTRYLDENSGKQIVIETNKALDLKANQSEITSARGGEVDLATKIGKIDSSLSEKANIQPSYYENMGIAFDSQDTSLVAYDNHASWCHGCVGYDESTDKFVVFYNIHPTHQLTQNRVLMRTKDVEGGFSVPIVVADRIAEGYSCKTQSSGIALNGDYISLVALYNNSTGEVLGTYIYRSSDKGVTWTNTEMLCGGSSVKAFNGDVTGFLVLKSGRVITWADRSTDRLCTIMYSDDNCATWNFATINGGAFYYTSEPAWCELSDGTIICIARRHVANEITSPMKGKFTKSTDGGLTWSAFVDSTSILDLSESNGEMIYWEDLKAVEFIHHSRYAQADGYTSLYVCMCNEEDAKNDNFGVQHRIGQLAPYIGFRSAIDGSTGDSGYVGAKKSKNGIINAFYFTGTRVNAQICYSVGRRTPFNNKEYFTEPIFGKNSNEGNNIISLVSNLWEQGSYEGFIGGRETLTAVTDRLRLIPKIRVMANSRYSLINKNTNYNIAIWQQDINGIILKDSSWQNDYQFFTLPNTYMLIVLIKKIDGSVITTADLANMNLKLDGGTIIDTPYIPSKILYNEGNEKTSITGGWIEGFTANTGASQKYSDALMLSANGVLGIDSRRSYKSTNPIDVTNINKINAVINVTTNTAGDISITLFNKEEPTHTTDGRIGLIATSSLGLSILSCDVSTLTGLVYVNIFANHGIGAGAGEISATVYKVWME